MSEQYNAKLISNSKTLRKSKTKEERHLWYDCLKQLPVTVHRQKVLGSYIVDFYIAHMLEIECVKECQRRGIKAPCWSSANTPGGDEKNAAYLEKYRPRIKML